MDYKPSEKRDLVPSLILELKDIDCFLACNKNLLHINIVNVVGLDLMPRLEVKFGRTENNISVSGN